MMEILPWYCEVMSPASRSCTEQQWTAALAAICAEAACQALPRTVPEVRLQATVPNDDDKAWRSVNYSWCSPRCRGCHEGKSDGKGDLCAQTRVADAKSESSGNKPSRSRCHRNNNRCSYCSTAQRLTTRLPQENKSFSVSSQGLFCSEPDRIYL